MKAHSDTGKTLTGQANLTCGAKEWTNNCARCHDLRPISEFSADNWKTIMLHMRLQAGITGQEARDIYALLAGQTPPIPTSAVNVQAQNTTAASSTAVTTELKTKLAANMSATNNKNQQPTHPAVLVVSGAIVYQHTCVACHGAH